MQQNDVLYVEPDMFNFISANIYTNRGLVFQIGGVALGVASILISILRYIHGAYRRKVFYLK